MKQVHQIFFVSDDTDLHASISGMLQAGNDQRDQHFMLWTPHASAANQPTPDLILLDYRGRIEQAVLRERMQDLPAQPLIILGDDETNLEDPDYITAWREAGAFDYLPRAGLTSHWLRHALQRTVAYTSQERSSSAKSSTNTSTNNQKSTPHTTIDYAEPVWQLFDQLFNDIPVLVCAFTGPDHVYRYANELYLKVVGERDVVGKPIREALPELAGQGVYELLDEVYATGQAYTDQEQLVSLKNAPDAPPEEYTFTLVYAPVAIPIISIPNPETASSSSIPPSMGAETRLQKMIFVIAINVNELVRVRRQWQEAHAQLDALFASSPLGLAFVDRDLRFLRINPALATMNGLPADQHIGKRPDVLLPELHGIDQILEQWRQIIDTGEPMVGIEVSGRTPALPDQDQVWEESWFPVMLTDEVLGLGIAAENITKRKEADAEREHLLAVLAQERRQLDELNQTLERRVQERSQQVRRLATELTLAEQRERHRIAQILHDHIQQLLYGIDFRIALLHDDAAPDQRIMLQEFKEIVREAIQATRTLAVDLSPPVLQGEGLGKALRWLIHQMEEIHTLRVSLNVEEPLDVTQIEMRVLLLQSVRELLFNVVKHAHTDEAIVTVQQQHLDATTNLIVQVLDRGQGFDVTSQSQTPHSAETFGLYSIRERLHLLGGYLDVDSTPDVGTRVTLVLPMERTSP